MIPTGRQYCLLFKDALCNFFLPPVSRKTSEQTHSGAHLHVAHQELRLTNKPSKLMTRHVTKIFLVVTFEVNRFE